MNKIKNEIFRITGIMLLFLILFVSGAQSQTNINSCTTISVPGEYVLTQDLIGQPSGYHCIDITSSDVIFNGAGHIIDGVVNTAGTAGIVIDSGNITIENTTIIHWDFDITSGSGNAIKIIGNNLGNADTMCIFLNHATGASVKSNNISDSYYGIGLSGSTNLLKDNIISRNVYGIWIGMTNQNSMVSSNDLLEGNTVTRNDYGVYIDTLGSNILSNNIILNNGIGVYSNFSTSNALYSNNMSTNNISINLDNSSFNTVKNNNVSISGVGIFLHSSVKNSIYDNYFYNNYNAIDNNGGNIWNVSKTLGVNIIGGPYIGGNFWTDYTGNDTSGDRLGDTLIPYNSAGNIKSGGDFLPLTMSLGLVKIVASGETVTSDTGGIGTSLSNPVVVNVTSPNSGTVTIDISHTTQTAPSGFSFLNQQIDITAPPTTAPSLLKIVFTISSTQIPLGQDQNTIQIFKNGIVVNTCPGSGAIPDPCISNRTTLANGDIQITIFSSSGDPWNIGIPVNPAGPSKGSISGMKFNDTNFNTIKDPGEPGINGWKITLSNQSGVITTQLTSGNGNYNFTNLPPDNYTVAEVIQPGWLQIYPQCLPDGRSFTGSCAYTVNLRGENIADRDFGNFLMGKISGKKFNDINGNGIKDPGEPGLPNWTINLILGNVTFSTTTDGNGDYNFSGLLVGTYNISEIIQPGWIQTAPAISSTGSAMRTVTILTSGANATLQDFGNFKLGEIHGTKFEDLNANGIKDQGEAGLQGWKININGIDTITNTVVNKTTITDVNGDYNFTGLTNGTYTITETAQNNWAQSAPANGKYTVIITSGAVITKQDFGNFYKGKITGGGWISIKGDPKATFGIAGQYPGGKTAQGNVEYQDHKANLNIKSIQINTVATTLDNKKGAITGLAQVNGAGSYPFVVYVEDNGEPGKGKDVFNISLPTYPYSNGAILSGGNIQIHG